MKTSQQSTRDDAFDHPLQPLTVRWPVWSEPQPAVGRRLAVNLATCHATHGHCWITLNGTRPMSCKSSQVQLHHRPWAT